ncbi:MAG: PD-(D/E)XK nuclease family protein [Candidatus Thorarchaeota archaeon]|jgi:hypothetical protein
MKEFFDAENRRVEFLDERFYQSDCGEHYYPSVTRVLDNLPKGPQFYMWMKDVGHNASLIAERAANEGTNVHDALERMMKGDEINWMDERGKAIYNKTEWQCILKGFEFIEQYNPKPIHIEARVVSDKYKVGGTADLICKMGRQNWLIDWKTSKSISESYMVQLSIYAMMIEEKLGIKIHNAGVLWLKSNTRGMDKAGMPKEPKRLKKDSDADFNAKIKQYKKDYGAWKRAKMKRKIQGKGWQFVPVHYKKNGLDLVGSKAIKKYLAVWNAVKYIYDFYNEGDKPKNLIYPTTLKI